MKMYILGVSCYYHDASACLLKDGKILAAVEEERFTRKKHDNSFPINAIKFCLKQENISINQVAYVAFYEKPLLKFERLLCQHLEMFPKSLPSFCKALPSWMTEKLRVPAAFRKKLGYKGDILFIEHHLAHAASSYLVSPFKEAAILTVDGVGEWATTCAGYGKGNDIRLLKEIRFPHSLGLLYSAVTGYLGFTVNNDEYKVMGLAPYGKPVYLNEFRKVIAVKEDGSYQLDMDYFVYHYGLKMASKKFINLFGPARKKGEPLEQKHKDIASSLQKITEEVLYNLLINLKKETSMKNVCLAGGVALNSVANGKILKQTGFKEIFIQPAASDSGTSIGAAMFVYNTLLGNERRWQQDTAYFGPEYSTDCIKRFLDTNHINYSMFKDDKELVKKTAGLIYKNHVIGWFQGKMEWGPRALGSRSILSNATNPDMKEILNAKVKHREGFRPFAPVVCVDDAEKYFECDKPVPSPTDYMLMVYPIVKKYQDKIPAVTHVDGSGRLQTIRRGQNRLYHDVIKEFGKLSGIPILVNTSFNIRGEPIVCTPRDAYKCMMGTCIDYLVMDKFLIARAGNPQHMWDSEKLADD